MRENYDTAINIDKDGFDVKFLTKTQRKTRIIYKGKDKDGKQIQSDVKGSPDGNIITVDFKGVTTKEALNKMAQEMANTKQFDGIEGSFQTWLYPVCNAGYSAKIEFSNQPQKNGTYYVNTVDLSLDASGVKRKITLSKRLS